ncbi:hypothetical protein KAT92_05375 [Candidatus Babeliales bacterium]|nr:hypothetical protein [Candidatus Babeliales bacterium]
MSNVIKLDLPKAKIAKFIKTKPELIQLLKDFSALTDAGKSFTCSNNMIRAKAVDAYQALVYMTFTDCVYALEDAIDAFEVGTPEHELFVHSAEILEEQFLRWDCDRS